MEQYKDIPGYEGHYMESSTGKVLSLKTGIVRKPYKDPKSGYYRVTLFKDGNRETIEIHRLVAMAWIPRPEGED